MLRLLQELRVVIDRLRHCTPQSPPCLGIPGAAARQDPTPVRLRSKARFIRSPPSSSAATLAGLDT